MNPAIVMFLSSLVSFLAGATAAAAAEPPTSGLSVSKAAIAFKPPIEDYYPAVSRDLKEQGLTRLKFCYDDRGRAVQVTVDTSSGFTRLDEAAVRYGNAVRIRPGLIDGRPEPGCFTLPVRFSLEKSPESADQGETVLPSVQVPPILRDIPPPPPPPPGRFIPLGGEAG